MPGAESRSLLGSLTPAQRRVLGLVADGLTNQEVAERQGVSAKTVANQLSAAYRRLGVRNRTAAIRMLREAAAPQPSTTGALPLIGRDEALQAMALQRAALERGEGQVLALVGPPGSGRTAMLRAGRRAARAAGAAVRRLHVAREAPPFTLAQHLAAALDVDSLPDLRPPEAWLPVGEAVLQGLEDHGPAPLLLVVDDLDEVDEGSAAALRHVAAHLAGLPVGLLVALTDRSQDRLADVAAAGHGRVVALRPLTEAEVGEVVGTRLGRPPGPRMREVLGLAAGIPGLVHELVEAWSITGRLREGRDAVDVEGTALPNPLRQRLRARLSTLDPATSEVVTCLALLGPDVGIGDLATAVGAQAADALDAAVRAGLAVHDGEVARLRAPLLAEAVRQDLSAAEQARRRGDLLARLAGAATAPAGTDTPRDGSLDTVSWLREAARAESTAAPRAAARRLTQALRLADDDGMRVALRVDLARALLHAGDLHEAQEVLEQARVDFDAWGRPALPGGHPMDVDSLLGEVLFLRGRLYDARPLLVAVGASDHPQAPLRLADAGLGDLFVGGVDSALDLAAQALSHPGVHTDHRGAVGAENVRSWGLAVRLRLDEALAAARRGVTRADRFPDGHWEIPWLAVGQAHMNRHEVPQALAALHTGVQTAQAQGMGWQLPILAGLWAATLDLAGRPEGAEMEAAISLETSREVAYHVGSVIPQVVLSRLALSRGELTTAEVWVAQAEAQMAGSISESADLLIHQRCMVEAARGNHEAAGTTMRYLLRQLCGAGAWLRIVQMALPSRRALPEDEKLQATLDAAMADAAPHTRPDRWDGLLVVLDTALRAGDLAAAAVAVDRLDRLGTPLGLLARCDEALARALLAGTAGACGSLGDAATSGEARTRQVHEAHRRLVAVGATADAADLADRAAQADPPVPPPAGGWPGRDPAALTATDRSVARLLVAGTPDGQVGRELGLTRTRVTAQVARLHRKLGTEGRAELIARLATADLHP